MVALSDLLHIVGLQLNFSTTRYTSNGSRMLRYASTHISKYQKMRTAVTA